MAEAYELIVFDWDGTLMDSAAAIVHALKAACADLGLPEPSETRARYVIGLGLGEALRYVVPDLPASDYPRLVERYRDHFLARDHELNLFDGMQALVLQLESRGRMLGVATGKSRLGLNRALAASGLARVFHATRCADECFSKPHPEMLQQIMDELGVFPERTLMVGDTTHDLQMARNAGVAALAVSFGAHGSEALRAERPLACLDTPAQLSRWLLAHG